MPGWDDFAKEVAGIAKEGYGDLVKPSATTLGEGIATLFKLATYYPRFWGKVLDIRYEQKIEQFEKGLRARIENIPEERRVLPSPMIAGPALQALEYAIFEDELREMFEKLLETSMDKNTLSSAHPSFVEIIKQITPDEARILRFFSKQESENVMHPIVSVVFEYNNSSEFFIILVNQSFIPEDSGCLNIDLGSQYLENLQRLGLIGFPEDIMIKDEKAYSRLEEWYKNVNFEIGSELNGQGQVKLQKKCAKVTSFGWLFIAACVVDKPHPVLFKESNYD